MKQRFAGYSLPEVLIAAGILMVALAASAILARTMLLQTEANLRVATALNTQEQAGVLYQLGLDLPAITNILPANFSSASPPATNQLFLTFGAATNTVSGVTLVNTTNCTIVFPVGGRTDSTNVFRTNQVILVRPSIL